MKYVLKKIASLLITLLIISFVTFFAFSVIPGDAALSRLGMDASEEALEALRREMGYGGNIFVRYFSWLGNALTGNFGISFQYNTPVLSLIGGRLVTTLCLAAEALLMIAFFSVPIAILASRKPNGPLDHVITTVSQMGMAIPQFFLGILLTFFLGILLHVFDVGGYTEPEENFGKFLGFLVVPAVCVAIPKLSMMIKYLRDCIVAEKKQDYVRTAKAKGNSENSILVKHILKNAILPAVTFFAMIVADVLAGSIVVEQVFAIPGLGRLLIASISNRDFPVVSAMVLYMASVVVIMNMLADITYRIVDRRVK